MLAVALQEKKDAENRAAADEVGKHHLTDLKQDVANTNRKYREVLAKHLQQVAREQERQRIEEQERNNHLDSLDFS